MVKNMHFISYLNLFDFTSSFLARFKVRIQYPTFSLQEFTAGHLLFFIFFFPRSETHLHSQAKDFTPLAF